MSKNNARLPDIDTLLGMGFNPTQVDKLLSYFGPQQCDRVDAIRKILRKNDRQQFVNRFQWFNLPNDLTGEFIERVLYYKYSGIFFYIPELNTFNFLPYVGKGLDEKGRYTSCSPLPFNGKTEKENEKEKAVYIPGLSFSPVYDLTKTEIREETDFLDGKRIINPMTDNCVILNSYCRDISQRAIPEQSLMDPLLTMMAEAAPLARTNLFANAGTKGMRVQNPDEASNVIAANASLERAALNGERFIPVVGTSEFQEFGDKGNADGDDFFMYMQTLDNIRLQSYGLKNNGIFEKSEYINNTMAGNIQANVGQIYQDALKIRQEFCMFVNAIWGLGIWCAPSETVTNSDTNMDGETVDEEGGQFAQDEVQGMQEVTEDA